MQIPTQVNICGKPFKVVKINKSNGGYFDEAKGEIGIGIMHKADISENIIHECLEGILAIRDLRFALEKADPQSGDLVFVLNHQQFEQAVKDLASALRGLTIK
jgi:hypothetical protein